VQKQCVAEESRQKFQQFSGYFPYPLPSLQPKAKSGVISPREREQTLSRKFLPFMYGGFLADFNGLRHTASGQGSRDAGQLPAQSPIQQKSFDYRLRQRGKTQSLTA